MPKNETAAPLNAGNPEFRYGLAQQLFSATPGISAMAIKEQATKLMNCARYLNHTGVMLGDHRRVAASHHLNEMVRVLLDKVER
ncbi:DUF3077 domain-containing protein [Pseudomonas sp. CC120222-01a]|uniref:DUF3077 domain-containing protein n=1 Tax=Pseudomonas sp. CC120222-01a TaxID=1378075 RepID=UPI000D8C1A12|nr:DUF3077 domain-containing protein [Pseudomonas sp. CC120222-01a]PVZ40408.1 Protein of unknown function (DUF3077) [Pseudomonas sp. CC120222-01a]